MKKYLFFLVIIYLVININAGAFKVIPITKNTLEYNALSNSRSLSDKGTIFWYSLEHLQICSLNLAMWVYRPT